MRGISVSTDVKIFVKVTIISKASADTISTADKKSLCFIHLRIKPNPANIKIIRIGYFNISGNKLSIT